MEMWLIYFADVVKDDEGGVGGKNKETVVSGKRLCLKYVLTCGQNRKQVSHHRRFFLFSVFLFISHRLWLEKTTDRQRKKGKQECETGGRESSIISLVISDDPHIQRIYHDKRQQQYNRCLFFILNYH
jgi:hypothetical protein